MLLGEPAPSQADLHFRLFGIPVRVHPFFWIATLLLGVGGSGPADPVNTLIWILVVFVSVLVHEFGHALTQRYYGGNPWVTLYSFGGLASCNDCDRSPRSQILILLAGPFAGFLFAAIVVAIIAATGHLRGFELGIIPVDWVAFNPQYALQRRKLSPSDTFVLYLLFVNFAWGLLNLLPVYPLDGGQIAREILTLGNARRGIVLSLQLSIVTAALVALYAIFREQYFLCLMFGILAYGSYQTLQSYRSHWQ